MTSANGASERGSGAAKEEGETTRAGDNDGFGCRNWLVEHIDGHDVLAVRKFLWAPPRTAEQLKELEAIVGVYWKRMRGAEPESYKLGGASDQSVAAKGKVLLAGKPYGRLGPLGKYS